MAYIDREKFAERIKLSPAFKKFHYELESKILQAVVLDLLGNMPAADVVEVKHGEWRRGLDFYPYCTVCGETPWSAIRPEENLKYCPNCGAKMDGRK